MLQAIQGTWFLYLFARNECVCGYFLIFFKQNWLYMFDGLAEMYQSIIHGAIIIQFSDMYLLVDKQLYTSTVPESNWILLWLQIIFDRVVFTSLINKFCIILVYVFVHSLILSLLVDVFTVIVRCFRHSTLQLGYLKHRNSQQSTKHILCKF